MYPTQQVSLAQNELSTIQFSLQQMDTAPLIPKHTERKKGLGAKQENKKSCLQDDA